MGEVADYTKVGGLYDVKICNKQGCSVETGHYKIKNPEPEGESKQVYSFPSTADNTIIFVPGRVVEDKQAFSKYVIGQTKTQQTCYNIDPCNVYTKELCCETSELEEEKKAANKSLTITILVYVLFGLLALSVISIFAYLAASWRDA